MEAGSEIVSKVAEMHMLMRIRIGSFYFVYRLAVADIIGRLYLSTCHCCGEPVREDLKHISLYVSDGTIRNP